MFRFLRFVQRPELTIPARRGGRPLEPGHLKRHASGFTSCPSLPELGIDHVAVVLLAFAAAAAGRLPPAPPLPAASAYIFSPSFCAGLGQGFGLGFDGGLVAALEASSASLIAASILAFSSASSLSPCSASAFFTSAPWRRPGCARRPARGPCGLPRRGLGVLHHLLDLGFGQARVGLDGDLVFLAGALVLGRDVQDAVGVDVEGDLDLRHAARRRRDVGG
jgi:hypothetical protein